MDQIYGLDDLFFDFCGVFDVKVGQEVVSYSNKSVFWLALELIYRIFRDQFGEFQGFCSEFFFNFVKKMKFYC